MAKINEDDLIKQGVPFFVVHFGKDMSTQKVESFNLENIDPDLYKAFARAILPDLREFVSDPNNQEIIDKWKRDNPSKR